ncbi:hypothetical protein GCM10009716_23790 [Streptomyces sodiiphilus]|uniref:Uncharacterized protein n=1 Tax=Streptomyces sodiiphilus TaxID=226217 RepID=A0ABN2P6D5_9ACTN
MSQSTDPTPARPDPEAANEAIRRYVRKHGGRPWGARERAELDRLRSSWIKAVRRDVRAAA